MHYPTTIPANATLALGDTVSFNDNIKYEVASNRGGLGRFFLQHPERRGNSTPLVAARSIACVTSSNTLAQAVYVAPTPPSGDWPETDDLVALTRLVRLVQRILDPRPTVSRRACAEARRAVDNMAAAIAAKAKADAKASAAKARAAARRFQATLQGLPAPVRRLVLWLRDNRGAFGCQRLSVLQALGAMHGHTVTDEQARAFLAP
jgi:hypothetical protein